MSHYRVLLSAAGFPCLLLFVECMHLVAEASDQGCGSGQDDVLGLMQRLGLESKRPARLPRKVRKSKKHKWQALKNPLAFDARNFGIGWLDWYTKLSASKSPLQVPFESDEFACQEGYDNSEFLYIGAYVIEDVEPPALLDVGKKKPAVDHLRDYLRRQHAPSMSSSRASAEASDANAEPSFDVDRICRVPKKVKYIVTPILNFWEYICGTGFGDIPANTSDNLILIALEINDLFAELGKYALTVDGRQLLSKTGINNDPNVTLTPTYLGDLADVGPPNYKDKVASAPPRFSGIDCDGVDRDENSKLIAFTSGYYVALRVKDMPEELLYDAGIPEFGFSVRLRYRFTYD